MTTLLYLMACLMSPAPLINLAESRGKSIFQIRSMQLQGDGLYTAWLIKVFAYLLALRLQAQGVFSTLTLTEIMRTLRREEDLRDFLVTHFHAPYSIA